MINTTIYFIRHGEIDNPQQVMYGRSIDFHLTEEGRQQTRTMAEQLNSAGIKLEKICTSPLNRTVESANIMAAVFNNAPILKEEDLTDVYIPALVGHPQREREEIHARGQDEYSGEFLRKGNESREEVAERMLKIVEQIRRENAGRTVAVLSHGDPLRFLLFCLENPDKPIPPMGELLQSYYPQKGEGWKMVFDKNGKIIERQLVTREGNINLKKEVLV